MGHNRPKIADLCACPIAAFNLITTQVWPFLAYVRIFSILNAIFRCQAHKWAFAHRFTCYTIAILHMFAWSWSLFAYLVVNFGDAKSGGRGVSGRKEFQVGLFGNHIRTLGWAWYTLSNPPKWKSDRRHAKQPLKIACQNSMSTLKPTGEKFRFSTTFHNIQQHLPPFSTAFIRATHAFVGSPWPIHVPCSNLVSTYVLWFVVEAQRWCSEFRQQHHLPAIVALVLIASPQPTLEAGPSTSIQVYKQKVRHLLYEHKVQIAELKTESERCEPVLYSKFRFTPRAKKSTFGKKGPIHLSMSPQIICAFRLFQYTT